MSLMVNNTATCSYVVFKRFSFAFTYLKRFDHERDHFIYCCVGLRSLAYIGYIVYTNRKKGNNLPVQSDITYNSDWKTSCRLLVVSI